MMSYGYWLYDKAIGCVSVLSRFPGAVIIAWLLGFICCCCCCCSTGVICSHTRSSGAGTDLIQSMPSPTKRLLLTVIEQTDTIRSRGSSEPTRSEQFRMVRVDVGGENRARWNNGAYSDHQAENASSGWPNLTLRIDILEFVFGSLYKRVARTLNDDVEISVLFPATGTKSTQSRITARYLSIATSKKDGEQTDMYT